MIFFSKLHPLLVHFPVGLLVSGVVFEIYGNLQKEKTALEAGRFNLRLGFWCALVTGGIGLLGLFGLDIQDSFRSFVRFHILFAFSTALLFGTALAVKRWFEKRVWSGFLYWTCLGVGLFSVLATGYFGGELVHRFGLATLQAGV